MDARIIQKKLEILAALRYEQSVALGPWEFRTADHLGPEQYRYDADFAPARPGMSFPAGKTVFLRTAVDVPPGLPLGDTYIQFDVTAMEGLICLDGQPYSGSKIRFRVPRNGKFDLTAEFLSVPELFWIPDLKHPEGRFYGANRFVVNRDIEACYYDIRFAWEAIRVTPDERRRKLLDDAVEAALLAINLKLSGPAILNEIRRARGILAEKIGTLQPDPEAGSVFLAGHTHIDTAWLWPVRETVRKCGRTFASSVRLMEDYPNYFFACSQAQLYQYTKKHFPAVYDQMKKWVQAGRWETTGGMWVEADCNVSSGESLIRQVLHGLRFYREEFNTRPRSCWLPDVFGYPASLPEILKGCGIDYFYTNKLHWQADNPFPHHLFRWRGLDGAEVVAHVAKLKDYYNGFPNPEQLAFAWNNYIGKTVHPEVLLPYGYGDGGGGPNDIMLEYLNRAARFPGLPATRTGPSEKYFDDIVRKNPDLPVWDGELYLETHRGTYTTQSETKRGNRKSELMLRDAEVFGVLSGKIDVETLRRTWETVLLDQFHDILPGSSIALVYEDTARDYAQILRTGEMLINQSLAAVAKPDSNGDTLAVFNSLAWTRTDPVTAVVPDRPGEMTLTGKSGRAVPVQVIDRKDGKATVVFEPAELPSCGLAALKLASAAGKHKSELTATPTKIETPLYILELTKDGQIARLFDKRNHREVVPAGAVANDLQLFQDDPECEHAWNVHATYEKRRYEFDLPAKVEVVESGPVRALVRVTRTHGKSRFEQDIILYHTSPRIDFVNRVDWHEQYTMLKVAFPVEVRTAHATYEVQFGAVERPTHRNTSWEKAKFEVCGHRWVDLSEGAYGVSLLNDCRYGYGTKENVMRLTLLRGTIFPDPNADQGYHEFTYAILPHAGDWRAAGTVREAWNLNVFARSVLTKSALTDQSALTLEGLPAVVETLKPADDGNGLILRLYEPNGARGPVTVTLNLPVKSAVECNHVEEGNLPADFKNGKLNLTLTPYQIRTFRLL